MLGWDVAFTSEGICLLEVNLSCNFFRGTFDKASYFQYVDSYWRMLEGREAGELCEAEEGKGLNLVTPEEGKKAK